MRMVCGVWKEFRRMMCVVSTVEIQKVFSRNSEKSQSSYDSILRVPKNKAHYILHCVNETHHHPSSPQEHHQSEYVEHARGKHTWRKRNASKPG